jgi:tRNA dimethylallyltransferase
MDDLAECTLLAGPTAVGKSEVALALAERIGGEIISVDSAQVYRGLDVGTAKPSAEERARVRHHLIDIVGLNESFDAARFVVLAEAAVREIRLRKKIPILCGGTGLYFKALLDGLGEAPAGDPALRAELEARPLSSLLAELARSDPETFERIDRKNPRRVVRAVEVCRLSGRPFSAQRAAWVPASPSRQVAFFGLNRPLEELHQRIERRVERMFAEGLIEETRRLREQGLEQNHSASLALGYRQVLEHLRGERSLAATVELVKLRTRQYAKRQQTWFRRQAPVEWLEVASGRTPQSLAQEIAEKSLFLDANSGNLGKGSEPDRRAANAQD